MSAPSVNSTPTEATAAAGERRSPLAFIIDEEASIRQFVSLILQGGGVDTIEFVDGASFRDTQITRSPDLVFLNVNLEVQDAVQSIETLSKSGFAGARATDQQPRLRRPRHGQAGRRADEDSNAPGAQEAVRDRRPSRRSCPSSSSAMAPASSGVKIELAEALKNNWVEFWYQPKIDLRRKQLAGAEAFARVCHPEHGVLPPASFMPGADEAERADARRAGAGERAQIRAEPVAVRRQPADRDQRPGQMPGQAAGRRDRARAPAAGGRLAGPDDRRHRGADRQRDHARQRAEQEARRAQCAGSRSTTSARAMRR